MILIFVAVPAMAIVVWQLCFPTHCPTASPALLTRWEYQLYLLDDDEDIRFVPPPFSPQRLRQFPRIRGFRRPIQPAEQYLCTVKDGKVFVDYFSIQGNVDSAFMLCTNLGGSPDLEICDNIERWFADGDWIVKEEAPLERRMRALESILSSFTGRKLVVEKRQVKREVIVARGKWRLVSDDEPKEGDYYYDHTSGAFVTHGGVGTLRDSFESLERELGRKFIDETDEPHPPEVRWIPGGFPSGGNELSRKQFLARLEKQTSLRFLQPRRVIPVWIVSEKGRQP
jgi:hypothetical protein